jgi:hypothetical protein
MKEPVVGSIGGCLSSRVSNNYHLDLGHKHWVPYEEQFTILEFVELWFLLGGGCGYMNTKNSWVLELFGKSPCLHSLFQPYPLFQWYLQSKEILLNLSIKCWNSAFNAQDLRVIIVVVQVGAVKIHVAVSSGGAQEKGKTWWNSVYYLNWWKN